MYTFLAGKGDSTHIRRMRFRFQDLFVINTAVRVHSLTTKHVFYQSSTVQFVPRTGSPFLYIYFKESSAFEGLYSPSSFTFNLMALLQQQNTVNMASKLKLTDDWEQREVANSYCESCLHSLRTRNNLVLLIRLAVNVHREFVFFQARALKTCALFERHECPPRCTKFGFG